MREASAELFIPPLTHDPSLPQYMQLFRAFEQSILSGMLNRGAKLAATRPLAQALGMSRNTVKSAFELLQAEGYIETRRGAGSFVADISHVKRTNCTVTTQELGHATGTLSALAERHSTLRMSTMSLSAKVLAPAQPALEAFPWDKWQRCVSAAGRGMKFTEPGDGAGVESLRRQLADYLHLVRGVICQPQDVLITSGSQQGVFLSLQLLLNPGDELLVEDPCYSGIDGAIEAIGARKVAVGVDREGFSLPAQCDATLAVVTPSRNYPLGSTMSTQRRLELLNWSRQRGAWIIEDDYDSEFRYDGPPLTALQGMGGRDNVIYSGTFSRILHPSIRIGYLVLPPVLSQLFRTAKLRIHGDTSALPQLALSEFMQRGYFASHVRCMRKLYKARRRALQREMTQLFGGQLKQIDSDGGMHCVYLLPDTIDDVALCREAVAAGLGLRPLSHYYSHAKQGLRGLVIGFAGWDEAQLCKALNTLYGIYKKFAA